MSLRDVVLTPSHMALAPPFAATDSAGSVNCSPGNDTSEPQTQPSNSEGYQGYQKLSIVHISK